MLNIVFKYKWDESFEDYVLTSKISCNGQEVSLWDTTQEETFMQAMKLVNIEASVDWDSEGVAEDYE